MRIKLDLLFLAATMPVWSQIAFTNLGPGDSYLGLILQIHSTQHGAMAFVPSLSGNLSTMRLALAQFAAPAPDLVISLRAPGPDPNGAVLEAWTIRSADLAPPSGSIHILTSVLTPLLSAGTTYWLRAESNIDVTAGSYLWY